MADLAQIMKALRAADAAGDTEAATRLAAMAKAARETEAKPVETPSATPSVPAVEGRPPPDYALPPESPLAALSRLSTNSATPEDKVNQLLAERANFKSQPIGVGGKSGIAGYTQPSETFQSDVVRASADLPADAKNANILWSLQNSADQGQVRPPDAVAGSPESLPRPEGSGPWVLNPQTGQYISREDMKANISPTMEDAANLGAFNSVTMGLGDNMIGIGSPYRTELMRALREKSQENFPKTSLAGDVVGALANPTMVATKAKTLAVAIKNGATAGAVWGALYGFNNADSQQESRTKEGAVGAILGGVLGGVAPVVLTGIWRTLRPVMGRASVKATVANLAAVKDTAYKVVENKGIAFNRQQVATAIKDFGARLQAEGLNLTNIMKTYPAVARSVSAVQNMVAKGVQLPLERLDKLRSSVQDIRFNPNTQAEVSQDLGKFVGAIDDMIDTALAGSDELRVAREAYRTWMQASKIDDAFREAALRAAASGSGGNIANTMKSALNKILLNEKNSSWFKKETLDLMESVVMGSAGQDVLRRIGKLSPNGNGLMLSLGILQAQLNPAMSLVSGVGAVAKRMADRTVQGGGRNILEEISGTALPRATVTGNAAPLIAPTVNALRGDYPAGQQ